MAMKEENEITVRVTCSKNVLLEQLKKHRFKKREEFSLDDYYLIPHDIDISKLAIREILSKAIIIRHIKYSKKIEQTITFKIKNINKAGEIINQKIINCRILSIEEAKQLFEAIGYYEIMNIQEDDIIYSKGDFEMAVKFVKNSNTLIEIETNINYSTIDELKNKLKEFNLPIDDNNLFVKKAEEELTKILQSNFEKD